MNVPTTADPRKREKKTSAHLVSISRLVSSSPANRSTVAQKRLFCQPLKETLAERRSRKHGQKKGSGLLFQPENTSLALQRLMAHFQVKKLLAISVRLTNVTDLLCKAFVNLLITR